MVFLGVKKSRVIAPHRFRFIINFFIDIKNIIIFPLQYFRNNPELYTTKLLSCTPVLQHSFHYTIILLLA